MLLVGKTNFVRFLIKFASTANTGPNIYFRQLFEPVTSTYTYLLADPKTKNAIIIDPVLEKVDRDVKLIKELGLNLIYAINTHMHADHITGTKKLKTIFNGCKSVISKESEAHADKHLHDGEELMFGEEKILAKATQGHTNGCMTYIWHKHHKCFTGDALFIRGCGRTDFQAGDPGKLYDSVSHVIFSLPDYYKIYPGHDYNGMTVSTVWEEKRYNPRLTKSRDEFIQLMNNLNLPYPKKIDTAVPANKQDGIID